MTFGSALLLVGNSVSVGFFLLRGRNRYEIALGLFNAIMVCIVLIARFA